MAQLSEQIKLKHIVFNMISAICSTDDEDIGVVGGDCKIDDFLLYEAQIDSCEVGEFGLEL